MKKFFVISLLVINIFSYIKGKEELPIRVLIPGWYQLEEGFKFKGSCLLVGEIVSLACGIIFFSYTEKLHNDYMDIDKDGIRDDLDNEIPKEVLVTYNFDQKREKVDLLYNLTQTSFYMAGGIFIYSLYDVTKLVKTKKEFALRNFSLVFNKKKEKVISVILYQQF